MRYHLQGVLPCPTKIAEGLGCHNEKWWGQIPVDVQWLSSPTKIAEGLGCHNEKWWGQIPVDVQWLSDGRENACLYNSDSVDPEF
jgi:hypothetical protein